MSLADDLFANFSFDLGDVVGGMNGLAPPGVSFDAQAFGPITGGLGSFSPDAIVGAISQVAEQGRSGLGSFANPVAAIAPIVSSLTSFEQAMGGDLGQLLARIQGGADVEVTGDLGQVVAAIQGTSEALTNPAVNTILQLLGGLLGQPLNIGGAIGAVGGHAGAINSVISTVASLMQVATQVQRLSQGSRRLEDLIDVDAAQVIVTDLVAWGQNTTLAARIAAVSDSDAVELAAIEREVRALVGQFQNYSDLTLRAMGFGEAALSSGFVDDALALVSQARQALRQFNDPTALRSLTTNVQVKVQAALPSTFAGIDAPVQDLANRISGMLGQLETTISGIDATVVTGPISGIVGQLTSTLRRVSDAIASVENLVVGALTQVKGVVTALPIREIATKIQEVLAPVAAAITAVQDLLTQSTVAITDAMNIAQAAINLAKDEILAKANLVKAPFTKLAQDIEDLHIPQLISGLSTQVDQIVNAISQIQLDPFFDTANQVIDTSATIIDAIPFDILPDDAKQKVHEAGNPIRAINFDAATAELDQALDDILDSVDGEVLVEVQNLFDDIVAQLRLFDPRAKLQELEAQTFDQLIARLRDIDVEVILTPIQEALDAAKTAVAGISLRADVLAQADGVFDDILAHVEQYSPAALLQPVQDQIATMRDAVFAAIKLDEWTNGLDQIDLAIANWFDGLDLASFVDRLEGQFDQLISSLRIDIPISSVIGQIVVAAMGADGKSPGAIEQVMRWIRNGDVLADLGQLVSQTVATLREAKNRVEQLQVAQVAAAANTVVRAIRAAVDGRPGTVLNARLLPIVAPLDPLQILAPALAYQDRYVQALDSAANSVEQFGTAGLSELSVAIDTIKQGLSPLLALRQRGLELLQQFGVTAVGIAPLEVVAQLFAALRPREFLTPLIAILNALRDKAREIVRDGLIAPVKATIAEVRGILEAIDLSALIDSLKSIFDEAKAQIESFRPSTLLAAPLDAFENLQTSFAAYDPLAPVRGVVDAYRLAVDEIGGPTSPIRPSVMFGDLLTVYEDIVASLDDLNVAELFAPVMVELRRLEDSLVENLGHTSTSFQELQRALP